MNAREWRTVWRAADERLLVEARDEDGWVRHRTRTNEFGDGSVVIVRRGDRMLFVGADRQAVGRSLVELPRGQADASDVDPVDTARRELLEETGRVLGTADVLGQIYPESGLNGDAVNVVLGYEGSALPAAEAEYAEQFWLTSEDVRRGIAEGSIRDGITISALALCWAVAKTPEA